MMEFIRWLILIKIVLEAAKKILKDCDKKEEVKKSCDKKEEFKKVVIIEKDCDNRKRLRQKKRFSQMIINKQRFKKILTDDHI